MFYKSGFSYVPIQLLSLNDSTKFKFDSYLIEENENLNDTFIDDKSIFIENYLKKNI